jgi:hypothetical protein
MGLYEAGATYNLDVKSMDYWQCKKSM